eukprot:CAMPEP_0194767446 /NCGR_PEP_ID=MMETSP0323_2-20130528/35885_1 /TAXON_ID=2866 ORGANISM="Crypthecodinium cohnii, Strain Seligo" /NCGR_SAMPLE_ID=MMETSP0323_2 /ASSEMBLY_ACC=CAM_ASM_000346 /LENGTH=58 /DNA_ID=CAMNT_0039699175 /DNA_START=424 /DNA_END=597 /DNA_ORIENTATION=+
MRLASSSVKAAAIWGSGKSAWHPTSVLSNSSGPTPTPTPAQMPVEESPALVPDVAVLL